MTASGETSIERVRRVVASELPHVPPESIVPLGSGLDHDAFVVDGDVVVRTAQEDDVSDDGLRRQADLLRAVAAVSPVAVPEPLFVAGGCMAYRMVPGVPLLDLAAAGRERHAVAVGRTLGTALAAVWALPAARAAELAERDEAPLSEWHEEAAEIVAALGDDLPASARGGVRTFLRLPAPDDAPVLVLSHNDLGIEHVLVDPPSGRVTGIIDWSDAAITDPAKDLGLILRDLGPSAFAAAIEAADADGPGVRERAAFYARCLALEDLAFGLEHGRPLYVEKSLDALPRLF